MFKPLRKINITRQKMILILLAVIILFFGINLFRTWFKNYQIGREISTLEQEINSLQTDNQKLAELINYFNSNAYIEEKARVDLGLKKAGEKVVMISGDAKNGLMDGGQPGLASAEMPNPYKWWLYFFK